MYNIIRRILCIDTRLLQIGLTLYIFLWGIWLFLVPNIFSLTNSFRLLEAWGGETFWGNLMTLLSIAIVLSFHTKKLTLKRLTDLVTFIIIGAILTSFIFAGSNTTIVPAFIAQTIISGWVLLASFTGD